MMDGAKIKVLIKVPVRHGSNKVVIVENDFVCKRFRRILPPGPTGNGGYRDEPILQFWAVEGGLRTVSKSSILSIR